MNNKVFGWMLVVLLLIPQVGFTGTISAKVNTDNGASTREDRMDPDVWWTSGTFHIDSSAEATDPKGTATDVDRWPAAGFRNKNLLPVNVVPPVPGSDNAPASGTGADFSASAATSPGGSAWGYSWGSAYLDTTLINEYEMNVHAYGFATLLVNDNAQSAASITDPGVMGWSDNEDHTLISDWRMASGTEINVEQSPYGTANAKFKVDSFLDLNNDSIIDQLFWSVEIGWIDDLKVMDVFLGPDVFIYDGRSKASLLAQLDSFWIRPGDFNVTSDFLVPFAYTVSTGSPGSIGYTFNVSGSADAQSVPEPSTLTLLGCGAGLLAFVLRKRKGVNATHG